MITVLGATGNTGRRITRHLHDEGTSVRAVGRDADRLAAALGPADARLEHHVGDADDRAFLARALDGADAAYVLMPFDPTAAGYHAQQQRVGAAIAGALTDTGVPRVVALSSLGAELPSGTGFLTSLHDQEGRLAALDAEVLVLRPGMFFESFLPAVASILDEGVHHDTVDPAAPVPMVATRDVADAAVEALLAAAFVPGVRELLGPADLTWPTAVAELAAGLGAGDAAYVALPDDVMRPILLGVGLPADVVELQLEMHAAFSRGAVRATTATRTPTSLREWAAAQAGARRGRHDQTATTTATAVIATPSGR